MATFVICICTAKKRDSMYVCIIATLSSYCSKTETRKTKYVGLVPLFSMKNILLLNLFNFKFTPQRTVVEDQFSPDKVQ